MKVLETEHLIIRRLTVKDSEFMLIARSSGWKIVVRSVLRWVIKISTGDCAVPVSDSTAGGMGKIYAVENGFSEEKRVVISHVVELARIAHHTQMERL